MYILKHAATKTFARLVAQFLIASVARGLLTAAQFRLRLNFAAAALVIISHDLRRTPSLDVFQSLFRVLPEALQNSVKHTGTKQLEAQLLERSDAIQLERT